MRRLCCSTRAALQLCRLGQRRAAAAGSNCCCREWQAGWRPRSKSTGTTGLRHRHCCPGMPAGLSWSRDICQTHSNSCHHLFLPSIPTCHPGFLFTAFYRILKTKKCFKLGLLNLFVGQLQHSFTFLLNNAKVWRHAEHENMRYILGVITNH